MIACHLFIICCVVAGFISCQKNRVQPPVSKCSSPACSCCMEGVQCQANGFCDGQCKDGYFGGKCITSCPFNCVRCQDPYNPTGDQSIWSVPNCTLCKDGLYSTTQFFQCQLICPSGCVTCKTESECSACAYGYYKNGENMCSECKRNCHLCTNKEECSKCIDGYYGKDCLPCANGCVGGRCQNQTGECVCKPGYHGVRCDACLKGYFKTGDSCIKCSLGCESCTSIDECMKCLVGYYGQNCSMSCPPGCKDNLCDRPSGSCKTCIKGDYGSTCSFSCSKNCINGSCDQETGECECVSGYSGDTCCHKGQYCQNCSSIGNCSVCEAGKYGTDCLDNCPENYFNNNCGRLNGTCNACPPGFSGPSCKLVFRDKHTGVAKDGVDWIRAAVIGLGVFTVVLIFVIISLIVCRKRNQERKSRVFMHGVDEQDADANTSHVMSTQASGNYETLRDDLMTTQDSGCYETLRQETSCGPIYNELDV